TDASGDYNFGQVDNFQQFVLMADPEDIAHPMGVETYYPQEHLWENAHVFNMCGDNFYKHIELIPPMEFNGSNTLSGTVWHITPGKVQTEEDPIPLIDVVVEKTPPGQAQGRAATNGSGEYSFNYVPSSDTVYTLYVNLPGVPVSTTYEILADMGDEVFANLDFCVNIDSTEISICPAETPVITGEQPEVSKEDFVVYPNPNQGVFSIETGRFAATYSEVRIVDTMGRVVFQKQYDETPYIINMVNVADGYYSVQLMNQTDAQASPISVIR
ncbi:MAG: T9SS type A sorting domain-containing protein, partial [Flavobacteriales bacterium]